MGFIRVIHHRHYDRHKRRFTSPAFKNSNDNSGISVIDKDCALRTSPGICEHIQRFYPDVAGTPPIFWEFHPEILPENCRLDPQKGPDGDDCHFNVVGLSEKEARAIIIKVPLSDFNICIGNGEYRPLTESDVESWT